MTVKYEELSYQEKVELFKKLSNEGISASDKTCKKDLVNSFWYELSEHNCPGVIARKITDLVDHMTANYELNSKRHMVKVTAIPKDKETLYKELTNKICTVLNPYEKNTEKMWAELYKRQDEVQEKREQKPVKMCKKCTWYADGICGNEQVLFNGHKVKDDGFCMKWEA